ncbi:hypothetical protein HMI56_002954 [Coelomomyces lativittatus]|nr:hypothetical protein HMI56_002954 [Coelomomyces lativittatus]
MSYIPTTFPKLPQSLPPLQSVMLFSGVYDLVQHYQYECERGIEEISGLRRANGIEFRFIRQRERVIRAFFFFFSFSQWIHYNFFLTSFFYFSIYILFEIDLIHFLIF